MARISSTLKGLEKCLQCSIPNPNLEYRSHFLYPYPTSTLAMAWFAYQCATCHDLVAARGEVLAQQLQSNIHSYLQSNVVDADVVLPYARIIDEDIPQKPRMYLAQAVQSLHAPDGAVMLAGSAVDAMLKLKGYDEGSVYARIERAVGDHTLTPAMSEWAHAVRLGSNKPRHADLEEPHATKDQAEHVIEFAEALGEFLFVLPARIDRGKATSLNTIEPNSGANNAKT